MIGYIALGFTIFLLILFGITSYFFNVLTPYQESEMILSTILFIAFLGLIRGYYLGYDMDTGLVAGLFYLIWYFSTKFFSNLVNRQNNILYV